MNAIDDIDEVLIVCSSARCNPMPADDITGLAKLHLIWIIRQATFGLGEDGIDGIAIQFLTGHIRATSAWCLGRPA